ncbi:LysR family transcriptional regulator [Clostridium sp. E02]|uniref:LysR family transcriptional regulator n=1 Tax=Clostridium sp. E02 TaxID=2487134 RepID=UPI000F53577F|nr:LysR family transcriptional regulator [Clostridium sp. E02]
MGSSLEYYKVFYYVAKLGSITLAAEKLCISQPAVSQAVKQLEQSLDTQLFMRMSKGVRLTREGEFLYGYVKSGLDRIWNGENMLRRMKDLDTGEVRIGASDMTLQFYLLPYLEQFHELYPGIKVSVSNGPTPETLDFLYDGKIDFGVVSTPLKAKAEVRSTMVKEIHNVFVAGEKFRYLEGKKLDYEVLKNLPCIFLEKDTSTRTFMDEFLMDKGVEVEPEFELSTSDMIVQFAIRNLGIGCVMSGFADAELGKGKLFELKFKDEMPDRHFSIITDSKTPISPPGKKLLKLMLGDIS